MYNVHSQHLDLASGFHVIELRDEKGHTHIVQIAVGADSCPACGHAHPKDYLGQIDPKAMVAEVNANLNKSQADMLAYARKHGIPIK